MYILHSIPLSISLTEKEEYVNKQIRKINKPSNEKLI